MSKIRADFRADIDTPHVRSVNPETGQVARRPGGTMLTVSLIVRDGYDGAENQRARAVALKLYELCSEWALENIEFVKEAGQ
jgi:hypothetical protein